MREAYACINAGDTRRIFALFTDQAARDDLTSLLTFGASSTRGASNAEESWTRSIDQARAFFLATLTALPAEQRGSLIDVRDVRVLPDGRVVAEVVAASPERQTRSRAIFAEENGRWRIAGTAASSAAGTPAAATPTP